MTFFKLQNQSRNIIFILLNFIYAFGLLVWCIKTWNDNSIINNYVAEVFLWFCGLMIVQSFAFKLKKVPYYDFCLWFCYLSYIFMFGLLIIDKLGLKSSLLWNPKMYYSDSTLFHAYIYIIAMLNLYSVGYLICYKDTLEQYNPSQVNPNKIIFYIGVVLLVIGIPSRIVVDAFRVYWAQLSNSYSGLYINNIVNLGILDDFACFFLPGIFFIYYSAVISHKRKLQIFYSVTIYLVVIMLLTGSRKLQVFSLLSLYLVYVHNHHMLRIFKIRYFLLGCCLIVFLVTIRENRLSNLTSNHIIQSFLYNLSSFDTYQNILGNIFAETGLTILSVASIIDIVPNIEPFQYGMTYLRTCLSVLPIGGFVGDFFKLAYSTYVISKPLQRPVGSSMLGDLYWNWGYLGAIIVAPLLGFFTYKVLYVKHSCIQIRCARYFSMFLYFIPFVRSEIVDSFRSIVWLIITTWLLNNIFSFFSKKRIK